MYKWWVVFGLILATAVFSFFLGAFGILLLDVTFMTFGILCLFAVTSAALGWISIDKSRSKYIRYARFASQSMVGLGMIGTAVGLFVMLSGGLSGIDASNVESVKILVSQMTAGIGTALLTTIMGMICSFLTRLQIVVIEGHDED
jgi:multisubunit Na+/H+ antiporter MnhC subunit